MLDFAAVERKNDMVYLHGDGTTATGAIFANGANFFEIDIENKKGKQNRIIIRRVYPYNIENQTI